MAYSRTPDDFLKLLEPIYPRLARFCLVITRDSEEAKDLTSDTVLVALEQFESMKDIENFSGYLFKIASRLNKRSKYRERKRVLYDSTNAESRPDMNPEPDLAAEIAIVIAALDSLPPKIREAVALFDLADLSLEEVRRIQGGTLSGVKSRLKRGRDMIKKELGIMPEMARDSAITENQPYPPIIKSGEYYAV